MSLKEQAVARAAVARERQRANNQTYQEKHRTQAIRMLVQLLERLMGEGNVPEPVDMEAGKYRIYREYMTQYNRKSELAEAAGWRVMVDDVILAYGYFLTQSEGWAVEVSCNECGEPTVPHAKGNFVQHVAKSDIIQSIGSQLAGVWLCGPCQARKADAICYTCHRPLGP